MATVALIVDWCGPFKTIEDASRTADNLHFGEALYFATGKRRRQRAASLQYVGISNDPMSRLSKFHHKLPEITADVRIWIGEISSHAIAGRKAARHPVAHSRAVELAEWALVYFLEIPLNRRKRKNPPNESVVLVNRWWNADNKTKRKHRGSRNWPDFIEYDQEYNYGRLQWFGTPGKSKMLNAESIKAIGNRA